MVGIGIRENFADFYASSNAPRAEKATWGYTIRSAVSTVSKPFIEMGNVLMSSSDHYCKLRDRAAKRAVKQSELYQLTESFQKIIDQMLSTQVKVVDQQKALKAFNSLVETSSKSALLDFLSLKTLQLPDDLSEKSVDEISSILYPPIQDRFTEELELAEQLQNQIAFNEIELHRGVISGKFANQMRKSIVKNSSELNRLVKILNRVGLIPDDYQYRAAWLQKFREKAYVQGSNSPEVLEQLQLAEEESLKIYAKRALEIYEDKGNEEGAAFCRQLMHLENAATGTEKAQCTSWRSEWKNWIQNHKKELLVAGGILGSCLVAYVSYRYLNNCPPSPQQSDLEEKVKKLEKLLQSCNENRENDLTTCLKQKKPEPKTSIQKCEITPPKSLPHSQKPKWEIKTVEEMATLGTQAKSRNQGNPTVIETYGTIKEACIELKECTEENSRVKCAGPHNKKWSFKTTKLGIQTKPWFAIFRLFGSQLAPKDGLNSTRYSYKKENNTYKYCEYETSEVQTRLLTNCTMNPTVDKISCTTPEGKSVQAPVTELRMAVKNGETETQFYKQIIHPERSYNRSLYSWNFTLPLLENRVDTQKISVNQTCVNYPVRGKNETHVNITTSDNSIETIPYDGLNYFDWFLNRTLSFFDLPTLPNVAIQTVGHTESGDTRTTLMKLTQLDSSGSILTMCDLTQKETGFWKQNQTGAWGRLKEVFIDKYTTADGTDHYKIDHNTLRALSSVTFQSFLCGSMALTFLNFIFYSWLMSKNQLLLKTYTEIKKIEKNPEKINNGLSEKALPNNNNSSES